MDETYRQSGGHESSYVASVPELVPLCLTKPRNAGGRVFGSSVDRCQCISLCLSNISVAVSHVSVNETMHKLFFRTLDYIPV